MRPWKNEVLKNYFFNGEDNKKEKLIKMKEQISYHFFGKATMVFLIAWNHLDISTYICRWETGLNFEHAGGYSRNIFTLRQIFLIVYQEFVTYFIVLSFYQYLNLVVMSIPMKKNLFENTFWRVLRSSISGVAFDNEGNGNASYLFSDYI